VAIQLKKSLLATLMASAIGAMLASGSAHALGLMQAYELALQNDPTYREAYYDNESGKEYVKLGRSNLLPSISGSYSASKVHADQDLHDTKGNTNSTQPEYISRSAVVQLRQPVFSLDALARYKQGVAQGDYSAWRFTVGTQDLVARLIGSYLDALLSEEQLSLAQAQRDMYAEQQHVNERMYQKGEGTKTDMLETQSRLELAEAQVIEAKDNLTTARNTLAAMTGGEVTELDKLGPTFRFIPLQPASFEEWKKLALENNADLRSQVAAIESARQEVNKARAGHTPRVDFIASYSKSAADTLNTYNQDSVQRSVGVQVNIPLYAGGSVNAQSRQAVANLEKARVELQNRTDKALLDLRKQYNLMVSGVSRINALGKAVESGKLLMTATEQSIKGGVRINLDLLNAQQQLYTSQRDLAQARYGYLIAAVRLRAGAGTLGIDDVREVAAYFH
jgi:protease secretion system outer membrane protein